MDERRYLSIGEVLSLLKEEFPDVTISKIRFLESQGLLDPERTPSGYRKFYETDVERLRWILRQQREHFLPLKVIKGRLRGGGEEVDDADDGAVAETQGGSRLARVPIPTAGEAAPLSVSQTGTSMTLAELANASGLDDTDLRELERYGLLTGRKVASAVYYDEEALNVAVLAAGFMKYGVEARHLRMYKMTGEREAGFFEQVVMPMLKQRNPQARAQATAALSELIGLGQGLRAAMVRQSLRQYFE
ncbi:MAG: MerR family transcriptional regulator [Actinomycetota bacterium]|nr:MerR family transcriptional regulator [Actinomycetota bacterium]